eukprot:46262-Eustigmatos_ZCMA.PRE.1
MHHHLRLCRINLSLVYGLGRLVLKQCSTTLKVGEMLVHACILGRVWVHNKGTIPSQLFDDGSAPFRAGSHSLTRGEGDEDA